MSELTMAWRSLCYRPIRSGLTALGLALAVGAVVALVGVAKRSEDAFLELYLRRGGDLVVQRAGGAVQLSNGVDQAVGDKIRRLPGVDRVVGCLMDMVSFEQADLFAVIVNGWAADSPVLEEVTLVEGRRLREGDRRAVMLGKTLATSLGKRVGDKIELYAELFDVVGVFNSFSVYESGAVFCPLAELQRLMNRPNHVTGYLVGVDQAAVAGHVEAIRRRIEALAPNLVALPSGEFVRNLAQIRVIRAMAWVTSLVALLIGAVGISNTMVMSILERQREIGALRALGWRTVSVVRLVGEESLLLCLVGAAAGSLLGIAATKGLSLAPMTAGLIDGRLSLTVIAQGVALALVAGLLGAIYPACWVARCAPLEALRQK